MNYDTLCFSSGGTAGISYIGAIACLIKSKILNLNTIKKYVGTSIGAIFLFFILLDYSILEINNIVIDYDLKCLQGDITIDEVLQKHGFCNGDNLVSFLKNILKKKKNINDITFYDLYNKYNKNFIVIGTNLSNGTEEAFNYINNPNMSVILAIRISVSLPAVFTPVLYNNNYYVDGGLKNTFPINYCDQKTTLAINLPYSSKYEVNNIFDVCINSMQIALKSISTKNNYIDNHNIINVNSLEGYSFFNFDITTKDKIKFIIVGWNHTLEHINNNKKYYVSALVDDMKPASLLCDINYSF